MFASKGSKDKYKRRAVKKYIILSRLSKKWGKKFTENGNPTNLKPVGSGGSRDRKNYRTNRKLRKFGYSKE